MFLGLNPDGRISVKRKAILKKLGISVLLLFAVHFLASYVAGVVTQKIFASGSGCIVEVHNAKLRYFPLRASVEDVRIYHPAEGEENGFRASKVEVSLELLALLRKKVVLPKLTLTDSVVKSIGEETGFIQVLTFLFKKRPKDNSSNWHDFISKNWGVWVQHVIVQTRKKSSTTLVTIGTEDVVAQADTVVFTSTDRFPVPGHPIEMKISGENLHLRIKDSPMLPLGEFHAKGFIKNGVLTVNKAVVADPNPMELARRSEATGTGKLHFSDEEYYDFKIKGQLFDDYAARLAFVFREKLAPARPKVELTLNLQGPLDRPVSSGQLQVSFSKGSPLFLRESCAIKNASAKYEVSVDSLSISELSLEDIVKGATFKLDFVEELPFSGDLLFSLDTESAYVKRCIPAVGIRDGLQKKFAPFSLAVHEALANSRTTVKAKGSIAKNQLSAEIDSEVYRKSSYANSSLRAQLNFDGKKLEISAAERGKIPKIGGAVRTSADAAQTRFDLKQRSTAHLRAKYDVGSSQLSVEKLELNEYPADRIAARVAPFLSRKNYELLAASLSPESEITANFSGVINSGDGHSGSTNDKTRSSQAEGFARVTNVELAKLKINVLEFPLSISNRGMISKEIQAKTPGGVLTANIQVSPNNSLRGYLKAQGLTAKAFSSGTELLEELQTVLDVDTVLSGSLTKPKVDGTILATSIYGAGETLNSNLKLESSDRSIHLSGSLLGDRAEIDIVWPFKATDQLALKAKFEQFPLPQLGEPNSSTGVKEGTLSADFSYHGSTQEPLKGSGDLLISSLYWPDARIEVSNDSPLTASIKTGIFSFDDVFLRLNDKRLRVTGQISQDDGWDAVLKGSWELESLSPLIQPLEQVAGNLEVSLEVKGEVFSPNIDGTVKLSNGSLSFLLANSVVGVSSAAGVVKFNSRDATLESFIGAVGDGKIVAKGRAQDFLNPDSRRVRVAVQIDDGRVEPVEDLPVQFNARLGVEQSAAQAIKVSGDVDIAEARYERKFELDKVITALTKTILGSDTTSVKGRLATESVPVEFDLSVSAPNGLLVETELGSGELRGNVRILGPADEISLDGFVEVITGVFSLGLNNFEILNGTLEFSPQGGVLLDPRVSIVAETNIEAASGETHVVRMSITGSLSEPVVNFSSDSGLTENEVVALFGFGGKGLNLISVSKDRTFTELLDPRTDISLRERLVGLTGFRDIQIESGLSEDTGEFVPRVRASRPLVGKSELELSSELSGEQVSEAEIQYPLNSNLDVTAGWRSRAVTDDVNASSGSYSFGIKLQDQFLGTGLFPPFNTKGDSP